MRLRNWITGLFILAGLTLYAQDKAREMVTVQELKKIVDDLPKNVVILDVRTEKEFDEGNIKHSENVNYLSPSFEKIMQGKDKSKTYYVYCFSGGRSAQATTKMKAMGFKNVIDVDKGIRAWTQAGYPLNK